MHSLLANDHFPDHVSIKTGIFIDIQEARPNGIDHGEPDGYLQVSRPICNFNPGHQIPGAIKNSTANKKGQDREHPHGQPRKQVYEYPPEKGLGNRSNNRQDEERLPESYKRPQIILQWIYKSADLGQLLVKECITWKIEIAADDDQGFRGLVSCLIGQVIHLIALIFSEHVSLVPGAETIGVDVRIHHNNLQTIHSHAGNQYTFSE